MKIVEYGVDPHKVIPIPAFCHQYLESRDGTLPGELAAFYSRYAEVVFCYTKIRRLFFPTTLIEAFAEVAAARPRAGLVLCGIAGHMEPNLWTAVQHAISRNRLDDRVAVVDDVPHEVFLAALSRARVYVRTHLSDGVCSSVLEALALRVPVVASENHHRPAGVITYPPEDAAALTVALNEVLSRYDEVRAHLPQPELRDTLAEEARVLTG